MAERGSGAATSLEVSCRTPISPPDAYWLRAASASPPGLRACQRRHRPAFKVCTSWRRYGGTDSCSVSSGSVRERASLVSRTRATSRVPVPSTAQRGFEHVSPVGVVLGGSAPEAFRTAGYTALEAATAAEAPVRDSCAVPQNDLSCPSAINPTRVGCFNKGHREVSAHLGADAHRVRGAPAGWVAARA